MGTAEYQAKKEREVAKRLRARHANKWLRKHRQKIVAQASEKKQTRSFLRDGA